MEFSGERYINENNGLAISIEHTHRYQCLTDILQNKVVADIACGTGHGTETIAQKANIAYGLDISTETIIYAKNYHNKENIKYIASSATDIPLKMKSLDAIVSFETIEHLDEKEQHLFLREIIRTLRPNGFLIISTPNKAKTTDISGHINKFHKKEFYLDEYQKLLKRYFKFVETYHQSFQMISSILKNGDEKIKSLNKNNEGVFFICVCSNVPLSTDLSSIITNIQENNPLINMNLLVNKFSSITGKIFIDTGNGFNEINSIKQRYDINGNQFKIKYDLTRFPTINQIRFDPIENEFVDVCINQITATLNERSIKIKSSQISSNGKSEDGKNFKFHTIDPSFIINIKESKIESILFDFNMHLREPYEDIALLEANQNQFRVLELETKNQIQTLELEIKNQEIQIIENFNKFHKTQAENDELKSYIKKYESIYRIKHLKPEKQIKQSENLPKLALDLIVVTYNSLKWINGFFDSLNQANLENIDLNLFVVDNNSTDDTVNELENQKINATYHMEIIKNKENIGFGQANNIGAKSGKSKYLFFLNIDTELNEQALIKANQSIHDSNENVAAWEFKQIPFEHPKYYDPVTQETSWFSGAAVIIKREVFENVGGFDPAIFMYAEDVDLSWRIRNANYTIKYMHNCAITHYSYQEANEIKPLQFFNSVKNNLLLRYRYGNLIDIVEGYKLVFKLLKTKEILEDQHLKTKRILSESYKNGFLFRKSLFKKYRDFKPTFNGFDYETARDGAFYYNNDESIKTGPFISIIIRTHKRKDVLREALISLRNQSYKNFEVIIVEDGNATALDMIESEFKDLNIIYSNTEKNVGRSLAGNIALGLSNGEYLNFLDDDDIFYPDHLEVLVSEILNNPSFDAVYATGFETPIEIISHKPFCYNIKNKRIVLSEPFSWELLLQINLFPIQTILFKRELFEKYGGFNLNLDYLEDWDLWLRYLKDKNVGFVKKTTSCYRVPSSKKEIKKRNKILLRNYYSIRKKFYESYLETKFDQKISEDIKVRYYIDHLEFIKSESTLKLSGWAFLENKEINSAEVEIFLLFLKGKDKFIQKINNFQRIDVATHFNCQNYSESGINLNLYLPETILKDLEKLTILLKHQNKYFKAIEIDIQKITRSKLNQLIGK